MAEHVEPELATQDIPSSSEILNEPTKGDLSKALDLSITFDLETVIKKYSSDGTTWNETSHKAFSDFLHHLLIYVIMNRGEDQKKVFTLKTPSEAIANYMKEQTKSETITRTQLDDPENYTSGDLCQEIAKENFDPDLQQFALSEMIKAIYKFSDISQKSEGPITHKMIHLTFDFEHVKEFISKYFDYHQDVFCKEVSLDCICISLTSLLEYVAAEVIELSSRFSEDNVLTVLAIQKGLKSDPALFSLPCTHIINENL